MRFDPIRFFSHLFFGAFGAGVGMVITFLIAWGIAEEGNPFSSRTVMATVVVGFVVILPMILPCAVAVLVAALLMRRGFPGIEPGGVGMILTLGFLGVLVELGLAWMLGVGEKGEVGRYGVLSAAVGGALCGIIIGWRMKRG